MSILKITPRIFLSSFLSNYSISSKSHIFNIYTLSRLPLSNFNTPSQYITTSSHFHEEKEQQSDKKKLWYDKFQPWYIILATTPILFCLFGQEYYRSKERRKAYDLVSITQDEIIDLHSRTMFTLNDLLQFIKKFNKKYPHLNLNDGVDSDVFCTLLKDNSLFLLYITQIPENNLSSWDILSCYRKSPLYEKPKDVLGKQHTINKISLSEAISALSILARKKNTPQIKLDIAFLMALSSQSTSSLFANLDKNINANTNLDKNISLSYSETSKLISRLIRFGHISIESILWRKPRTIFSYQLRTPDQIVDMFFQKSKITKEDRITLGQFKDLALYFSNRYKLFNSITFWYLKGHKPSANINEIKIKMDSDITNTNNKNTDKNKRHIYSDEIKKIIKEHIMSGDIDWKSFRLKNIRIKNLASRLRTYAFRSFRTRNEYFLRLLRSITKH